MKVSYAGIDFDEIVSDVETGRCFKIENSDLVFMRIDIGVGEYKNIRLDTGMAITDIEELEPCRSYELSEIILEEV